MPGSRTPGRHTLLYPAFAGVFDQTEDLCDLHGAIELRSRSDGGAIDGLPYSPYNAGGLVKLLAFSSEPTGL